MGYASEQGPSSGLTRAIVLSSSLCHLAPREGHCAPCPVLPSMLHAAVPVRCTCLVSRGHVVRVCLMISRPPGTARRPQKQRRQPCPGSAVASRRESSSKGRQRCALGGERCLIHARTGAHFGRRLSEVWRRRHSVLKRPRRALAVKRRTGPVFCE
ncbi:hypothetical protein EJ04DRAFT_144983 [Polyplosphaeria fusca]|uniref:Uncharacterized protein n=1 Tax=Polyplosphaeria fusca TaxID=682080 RepID=A0A9P4V540_9PLEO|nr:hypothetical protein EJ04DRAFT_144983 [Polyplosphaeria fusca]